MRPPKARTAHLWEPGSSAKRSRRRKTPNQTTLDIREELRHFHSANEWEMDFVSSVRGQIDRGYCLTPKQVGVVLSILRRKPHPTRPARNGQAPPARRDDAAAVRDPDMGHRETTGALPPGSAGPAARWAKKP